MVLFSEAEIVRGGGLGCRRQPKKRAVRRRKTRSAPPQFGEYSLRGLDLGILESVQETGTGLLKLLTGTLILGSAPTAKWAKMNLETPTTIIAVLAATHAAGHGHQLMMISVGGGSVTIAFI